MTEAVDRPGAVAVIGAGPHGLSALKSLLAHGITADGFDRADGAGGIWRFGAATSRVYESTHLISSKPFTQFPDFPMPYDYPDYPGHRQVLAYFQRYADHFGLTGRILFDTQVVSMREAAEATPGAFGGPRWDVTIRRVDGDQTTLRYDAVVIANGHNWAPKIPSYPGLADFAGEVLHSADYKSADQLRGRRVLVVGSGNTGCDIAVKSAQNAAAMHHSKRRGFWSHPKYAFGRPSDQVADQLLALKLPLPVRRAIDTGMHKLIVGDYTRYGPRKPNHAFYETHPVVNQNLVHYIGHGDVAPRPDVAEFNAAGAVFDDGSRAARFSADRSRRPRRHAWRVLAGGADSHPRLGRCRLSARATGVARSDRAAAVAAVAAVAGSTPERPGISGSYRGGVTDAAATPELAACRAAYAADEKPDRATEKAAVKAILAELATRAPGHSVEVRVPPHAAVQVIPGVRHRRGTPPALVQLDARTLIGLAVGDLTWADARAAGAVRASGERSDLTDYFPLYQPLPSIG